jgi:hypothetical protein
MMGALIFGTMTVGAHGVVETDPLAESNPAASLQSPSTPQIPADSTEPPTSTSRAIEELKFWKSEIDLRRGGLEVAGSLPISEELETFRSLHAEGESTSQRAAREESEIYQLIRGELEHLDEVLSRIDIWEETLSLNDLEGRTESTLVRAEAFSVERKYRRQLEEITRRTSETLKQWALVQQLLLADDERRVSRLMVLLSLRDAEQVSDADGVGTSDPVDGFEYYEVMESATLREISALPDVYGDAGLWRDLLDANHEKIADPSGTVPSGTRLVVPYRERSDEIEF